MEPEISRRCSECGAAVRAHAVFCPNCGQPTSNATPESSVAESSETAERSRRGDEAKTIQPIPASRLNETSPGVEPVEDAPSSVAGESSMSAGKRTIHVAGDGTPPKRHRMREAAREAVEENLLPRVEKLRQASTVVLDEAAYDPSLRFVLIAIVLFIIFLVILLASKILG